MYEEMKAWLSNGELDIDAMIKYGMFKETTVVHYCTTFTDSPWYGWAL